MKQEPELIDLFAMFAAAGLAAHDPSNPKHLAQHAYVLASEMMEERKNWTGDDHE